MGDGAKKYNGWANYETWCVHLWLTNEEGSYRYWSEEAERQSKEARRCEEVRDGIWTVAEASRFRLADQLKEHIGEASPLSDGDCSLYMDLLNAALCEVDWAEVAEAFLEEVEPDDEPEEDDQAKEDDEEASTGEDDETLKRERTGTASGPLFELGQTVCTPGALTALTREDIDAALRRHVAGDWGDMPEGERLENETAVKEGHQIHSLYRGKGGCRFYVITEADRSVTTVLLPVEY